MSEKGLLVIGKLLRKAETTDSSEEAEALLAKAQQLATRYSIDLARARYATAQAERRELVEEREVALGRPGQKHLSHLSRLFTLIARLNDCTVLLRGSESVVYPVGFSGDLDAVEALYRSLAAQMVRESDAWLATGEFSRTHLIGRARGGHPTARPMPKVTARGIFYAGFIERIGARLEQARDDALDEALRDAGEQASSAPGRGRGEGPSAGGVGAPRRPAIGQELSSTALALRAKEKEVNDFLAAAYPRLGTRTRRVRQEVGEGARLAGAAGRAAADRAQLRGQQALGKDRG